MKKSVPRLIKMTPFIPGSATESTIASTAITPMENQLFAFGSEADIEADDFFDENDTDTMANSNNKSIAVLENILLKPASAPNPFVYGSALASQSTIDPRSTSTPMTTVSDDGLNSDLAYAQIRINTDAMKQIDFFKNERDKIMAEMEKARKEAELFKSRYTRANEQLNYLKKKMDKNTTSTVVSINNDSAPILVVTSNNTNSDSIEDAETNVVKEKENAAATMVSSNLFDSTNNIIGDTNEDAAINMAEENADL